MRAAEHQVRRDQAAGLRRLFIPARTRVVALTGADVDRAAACALELARACGEEGSNSLLVDLSRGALARAAGMQVRYELMHVIDAHRRLEDVVYVEPRGTPVLPAARGARHLSKSADGAERFAAAIERVGNGPRIAVVLVPATEIETFAKLVGSPGPALMLFGARSDEDLTEAYAILKRVYARRNPPPHVVLDGAPAEAVWPRLQETARAFLGAAPGFIGRLSADSPRTASVAALARAVLAMPLAELGGAAVAHC